jgi:hypothetical protein
MKTVSRRDFLNLLAESRTAKRRKLLTDWASKKDVDAIGEISLNALKGNVKISPSLFKKLKRKKNVLRLLASKKTNTSKKKGIIKQHGGFLPFLIPAAISAVSSLLPAVIGAARKKR